MFCYDGSIDILYILGNKNMVLIDRSTTNRQCPECGTNQICRAHRGGGLDRILSLMNRYPYYCLQCPTDVRFYRTGRR